MGRKETNLESLAKGARFKSTFTLSLYLQQFVSISLVKQGYYFIMASLLQKNQKQKLMPKEDVYSSHVFYVKYNNHTETMNELKSFSFCLQSTLGHPQSSPLVFTFQLMKGIRDVMDQPNRKIIQDFQCVSIVSFDIAAHDQLSFIQFLDIKFDPPYAAEIRGAAICLMTCFQMSDQYKIMKSQHEHFNNSKINNLKSYFELSASMKKLSKKHRFNSYTIQKLIQDTFLGFKCLMSIPIFALSPTKSLNQKQDNSLLTNQLANSMFTLEQPICCSPSPPTVLQKYKSLDLQNSSSIQSVQYKLSQICQKQCNQQEFLNYLAFLQFQDQKLRAILKQIVNLGKRNQQVIEQLSECLTPTQQQNSASILHKVCLQNLATQYEKKKVILYGQKITNYGNSLPSADAEMKAYIKIIQGLKHKDKDINFFTKMNQLYNFVPSSEQQSDTLKYDKCPYLFYSHEHFEQGLNALQKDQNHCFDEASTEPEESKKLKKKSSIKTQEYKNLFILAHGYQASSINMQRLKISLKKLFPKSKYLVLKSYSSQMDHCLQEMGMKAAKQIQQYIAQAMQNSSKKIRIIMVGHSMGGIILRASLQHLQQQIKSYFHTFISFATPHLGYLNCKSLVTGAGIKLIESMHPSTSLRQLSNKDKNNIKDTFIYKLASSGSLRDFPNIITMSSIEDKYVPWNSARLQLYKEPEGIGGKNTTGGWASSSSKHYLRFVQSQMLNQILGIGQKTQSRVKGVHRFQVDFNIDHINLDTMIGRTAHVAFLSNQHLLSMVFQMCLGKCLLPDLSDC